MTTQILSRGMENTWAGILATASVLGSWIFACMMPFAAIGVLLAATLPVRKAMIWMGAVWATNQLVGYLILDYPRTANSFAHGGALLVASLGGLWVAIKLLQWRDDGKLPSLVLAFAGAFVAYELLLFAAALFLGGVGNFAPDIVWLIAKNDMAWFAGLLALRFALVRTLPRFFGSQLALRAA